MDKLIQDPTLLPRRGERFLVKKGSVIHTTAPCHRKVAKKDYWVTLTGVDHGYITPEGEEVLPVVEWAGSGGYWYRMSLSYDYLTGLSG